MKEVDFKYIEDIWSKNQYPLGIYIHSPYCRSLCSYCAYMGNLVDKDFDRYFNEVLPESIKRYKPIIDANKVRSIYFGGGTPNYNSDMKNLVPALELLKDVKCVEKTIELHMGIPITDETLDIVKKYGFNTVILCQQTFNKDLLKKYNRVYTDSNDMTKIVKELHDAGIRCGSDFLYFEKEPIEDLIKDMEIAISTDVDEITIAPIYQDKDEKSKNNILKIYDIMSKTGYYAEGPKELLERVWKESKTLRWTKKNLLPLLTEKDKFFSFIRGLDDAPPFYPTYTSVLGIGSFNNKIKKTYSNVNCQYYYCENFDGESTRYYLIKEKSFYDKMRDIIDWAEANSVEPPPSGVSFKFQNSCPSRWKGDYNEIGITYSIDLPMVNQSRYVGNLIQNKYKITETLKKV